MRYVILNGAEIASRDALYDELGAHLPLPEWFGRNLDALHDVLVHEILPGEDVTIELRDPEAFRENLGRYAFAFIGMLRDIAEEEERLTVLFGDSEE